ncbi:hypothetical protein ACFV6Y_38485 [Streptomyces massasporeus]|uniref:hypothetical protein n=1 Tax=Streptomyces massasporeus TaxID=67324 RepID=UPI003652B511
MTAHTCWCGKPVAGRGLCNTHHQNLRNRLLAYGKWEPDKAPFEPVRERVLSLRDRGLALQQIGDLAGVHFRVVQGIVYDEDRQWVSLNTFDKILAVNPSAAEILNLVSDGARIGAVGTSRRLRSLCVIGHPRRYLTARLGLADRCALWPILSGRQTLIRAARAREVRSLHDELWDQPGTCDITRQLSASKGWLPTLAWDDIDNPYETPDLGARQHVSAAERITELHDLGITGIDDIATRLGIKPESVKRELNRIEQRRREQADEKQLQEAS